MRGLALASLDSPGIRDGGELHRNLTMSEMANVIDGQMVPFQQ